MAESAKDRATRRAHEVLTAIAQRSFDQRRRSSCSEGYDTAIYLGNAEYHAIAETASVMRAIRYADADRVEVAGLRIIRVQRSSYIGFGQTVDG